MPTPFFLNDYEVVAKDAFLTKICPPIYAAVHAVMLSKKHRRSSTVQEEGLYVMKADTICCNCVSKQAHDKRGIEESLHAQITRARLTACEVGVFSREISQPLKIHPPPLLGAT